MGIAGIKPKKRCERCGELFEVGAQIPISHYRECGKGKNKRLGPK